LEEVDVRAGHKVFMEVGHNILLIAVDSQGILDQQLRPHPRKCKGLYPRFGVLTLAPWSAKQEI
jgi:hypothetical protein